MGDTGLWGVIDPVVKIVSLVSGLLTVSSFGAKAYLWRRGGAPAEGRLRVPLHWISKSSWKVFLGVFLLSLLTLVGITVIPRAYRDIRGPRVDPTGPHYLRSHPLPPEEQAARRRHVGSLTKSLEGMNSSDKARTIINAVPNIKGGVTASELTEMIEAGDKWYRATQAVSSADRKSIILALTPFLQYPIEDEMAGLVSGMRDVDKAECIKALSEQQKQAMECAAGTH